MRTSRGARHREKSRSHGARKRSAIPQPPIDPAKPHQRGPKPVYQATLGMSDEEVTEHLSEATPPVRVD